MYTPDILWLVQLGAKEGLMTVAQSEKVLRTLGPTPEIMDYAQRLIDDGTVTDIEKLENVAGVAIAKATAGEPVTNPFQVLVLPSKQSPAKATTTSVGANQSQDNVPAPPTSGSRPRETPPPPVATASVHSPTPAQETPAEPSSSAPFPFDNIAGLADDALARAMKELLKSMGRQGASDLHLSAGSPPFIRHNRSLQTISKHVLTSQEAHRLNTILLSPAQRTIFKEKQDYDYALALDLANRYRVNLMVHKQGPAGAYRMVPAQIKTLEDLGYSAHISTIQKLLSYHNGLILVTGPVGAGKTTTLASMVSWLNQTREDHIITVEDPIEVVQIAKGCNVTQREVGEHTDSFFTALKGALREDPDVIVIGELRDLETIEMAITASETGHLVIGTMHTNDAATTLTRLLDVFPPSQQSQIRASVAESLRGVICQRLLPCTNGGLVLACEILVNNTAIANLIRENKPAGLRNTMETGVRDGMCLMDNAIFSLWEQGRISKASAASNIANRVLRSRLS